MRPTDLRTDRRAFLLLGAGLGASVLTGCTLNNPFDTSRTPAAVALGDLSPDAAAAVQAVTRIRTLQADLQTLGDAFPEVAPRIAGLLEMHQEHLRALEPAVPRGVEAGPLKVVRPLPSTPRGALARVRAQEHTVHDQVLAAAGTAQSGRFARLLGTIAAAISQQLVEVAR